jgi:hypothetical protein
MNAASTPYKWRAGGFLHGLINNLNDGRFEIRTIKTVGGTVHIQIK